MPHKGVPAGLAGLGTDTRSVSECEEESHTSSNPYCFFFTACKFEIEAEVGRVTSGGQGTSAGEYLVHRAIVDSSIRLLTVFLGEEPDEWELGVELLGVGLVEDVSLTVPTGTLHVHTIDEATILGRIGDR